jgi:hypothetical protein
MTTSIKTRNTTINEVAPSTIRGRVRRSKFRVVAAAVNADLRRFGITVSQAIIVPHATQIAAKLQESNRDLAPEVSRILLTPHILEGGLLTDSTTPCIGDLRVAMRDLLLSVLLTSLPIAARKPIICQTFRQYVQT